MYAQPLLDAIVEAERLVREAPHIETEADLLEGLQYLAGGIAACTHLAFDYDRDHPFLQSGTGPFTKMGLDNPDTLYFGTRVQAGREYLVTGTRGTTTDLSFQLLGGEYTDDNVPDSETAFDDRKLDIAADGSFQWRFTPAANAQLVIREVYNDWSARRGMVAIARADTARAFNIGKAIGAGAEDADNRNTVIRPNMAVASIEEGRGWRRATRQRCRNAGHRVLRVR